MNFLELAQETRRLSGVGGTGPANVAAATGIELKIVNFVSNAWNYIQTHPKKWKWMAQDYAVLRDPPPGSDPLQTILNTQEYQLTDVDEILTDTFRSYETALGIDDRQRMIWVPWRQFRLSTGIVNEEAERPIWVSRKPTGELYVWPKPNAVYSIDFEYFKTPQILLTNDSVPEMPVRHHMLIVYEALKRFGLSENAEEVLALGESIGGSDGNDGTPVSGLWRALVWDQEYKDTGITREDEIMTVSTRDVHRGGGWYDY